MSVLRRKRKRIERRRMRLQRLRTQVVEVGHETLTEIVAKVVSGGFVGGA
jgi:hypothetical protein